jgi:hypothetical protein
MTAVQEMEQLFQRVDERDWKYVSEAVGAFKGEAYRASIVMTLTLSMTR